MGLLGDSFDDPQTLATFELAGNLMSPGAFGPNLARGMSAYQQTLGNSLDQRIKNIQLQTAMFGLQKQKQLMDLYATGFGDGQPTGDTAQASPATSALAQGAANGSVGPTVANAQRMDQITANPGSATTSAPSGGSGGTSGNSWLNPLGMPTNLAKTMFLQDPQKYLEAQAGAYGPTDFAKMLRSAGIDPASDQGRQLIAAQIQKLNYIAPVSLRSGGYMAKPDGSLEHLPSAVEGYTNLRGPDGNWQMVPISGGTDAVRQSTKAATRGKLDATLGQGVDGNGLPTYFLGAPPGTVGADSGTSGQTPSGQPNVALPIRNNNPGAVSPGGKVANYASMDEGIAAADKTLQNYGLKGINTVRSIVSTWAPPSANDTDAYIKHVTSVLGVGPDQKIDLSNPLQRSLVRSALFLHESPSSSIFGTSGQAQPPVSQPGQPSAPGIIRPANAPGYNSSQETLATGFAKNYQTLLDSAADSKTRVNVLDNILGLSKAGVASGPTADYTNKLKGILASIPGASDLPWAKNWQDDVSHYQELTKYLNQYGIRQWQAAGGTGTDAQLTKTLESNVNNHMFPQALQMVAQWTKASELALQGKANAAQNFKDANGGNVSNFDQFERTWRNNFDPVIFQLKAMPADQQAAYIDNLKKTNKTAYQSLLMKSQTLQKLGAL